MDHTSKQVCMIEPYIFVYSNTKILGSKNMNFKKIPDKLYKYRKFDVYSLRLFTDASTYYSEPRYFNDPLDCNPTIEIDVKRISLEKLCFRLLLRTNSEEFALETINRLRYDSTEAGDYETDPSAEKYLKELLAKEIRCSLKAELGAAGVFSLAEKWDCPLMWSHYADQHRGLCIQYDTSLTKHPNLGAVDYQRSRSIKASDLIAWKLRGLSEAEQRVGNTYFFTKSTQWKYEQEWRDIRPSSGASDEGFPITSIYFGLRCDEAVRTCILKLVENSGLDVTFHQIYDEGYNLRCSDCDHPTAKYIRTSMHEAFKDIDLTGLSDLLDET